MKIKFAFVCFLLASVSCFAQESLTVSDLNAKYFKLLPDGKTRVTVDIRVEEFSQSLKQVSELATEKEDENLAREVAKAYAVLRYSSQNDSAEISISAMHCEQGSPMFEAIEQIKHGYQQTVQGAFEQIKGFVFTDFMEGYQEEPVINFENDRYEVSIKKAYGEEHYSFSKDFKEIVVTGTITGSNFSATVKAEPYADKLLVSTVQMNVPQTHLEISFQYEDAGAGLVLKETQHKIEMPGMNMTLTLVYTNWIF